MRPDKYQKKQILAAMVYLADRDPSLRIVRGHEWMRYTVKLVRGPEVLQEVKYYEREQSGREGEE